eukprot:TRINITY_DN7786_c0_g1_i2.p1 TRINITY_DN7786_c0_g1~~TRINITY_DN7786_c0_g1_i2.p1  ORF type:complete len:216 (-),score=17.24 TRINITY_DN7786_c0_g1_i2:261-908(-)
MQNLILLSKWHQLSVLSRYPTMTASVYGLSLRSATTSSDCQPLCVRKQFVWLYQPYNNRTNIGHYSMTFSRRWKSQQKAGDIESLAGGNGGNDKKQCKTQEGDDSGGFLGLSGMWAAYLKLLEKSPLFVGLFITTLMTINTLPQFIKYEEIQAKLHQDWFDTVKLNWTLWVPAQTLNFWLVPPNLQVLVANITAIIWNVILSYFANRKVIANEQQ